jgi:xylan 1,4-beta-xylosidase
LKASSGKSSFARTTSWRRTWPDGNSHNEVIVRPVTTTSATRPFSPRRRRSRFATVLSSIAVVIGGALLAGHSAPQGPATSVSFSVSMRVDVAAASGPLKPIWRFFGADEPNDAYMTHAYTAWRSMGSPQQPSPAQYARLDQASELTELSGPSAVDVGDRRATIAFTLPRQAVSLLVVEW